MHKLNKGKKKTDRSRTFVDIIYDDDGIETDNKEKETRKIECIDVVHDKRNTTEALVEIVSEDREREKKELRSAIIPQPGTLQAAKGKWEVGMPSPNPSGAPSRKKFLQRLRDVFGADGNKLIDILIEDMESSPSKSNRLKCENTWKFLDQMFGKAPQKIESEIDARVTSKNLNITFVDAAPRKESEEGEQDGN